MRIESQDRRSHIELERRDEGGYLVLDVAAALDEFTGHLRSVIVADAPAFLRDLAAFEASRQGRISCHGDEGEFELQLQAQDRLGHLWVGVSLARGLHRPRSDILEPTRLSGGFAFDAEHSTRLFAELRDLLS
jgi:hypothetical protein